MTDEEWERAKFCPYRNPDCPRCSREAAYMPARVATPEPMVWTSTTYRKGRMRPVSVETVYGDSDQVSHSVRLWAHEDMAR